MTYDFNAQRRQLLASLVGNGVSDQRVLSAIADIPREAFIDPFFYRMAYEDRALPIGMGQTISQPLMVAMMTQALQLTGSERVLEVGTGSGYQTAILSRLASYIYSIERYAELAYQAAFQLCQLGIQNVSIYISDGSLGWPKAAPYDRMVVTAAAPAIPRQLVEQLVMNGLLVIPVGSPERQELQVVQRVEDGMRVQSMGGCVFVPLVGEEGWRAP
jgi:protein-L-isoaspartate(D-aspartate) O-methyltransferase